MNSVHCRFYKAFLTISIIVHLIAFGMLMLRDVKMPGYDLPFEGILSSDAIPSPTTFFDQIGGGVVGGVAAQAVEGAAQVTMFNAIIDKTLGLLGMVVWFGMLLLMIMAVCYLLYCVYLTFTTRCSPLCIVKRLVWATVPLLIMTAPCFVVGMLNLATPKLYSTIIRLAASILMFVMIQPLTSCIDCCFGMSKNNKNTAQ
ncbi:MAG: hypothetical protein H6679_02470 [Epsilonproteobacteria bacterium]|nr:hypothetical protein [Campylobacterota bacterium]